MNDEHKEESYTTIDVNNFLTNNYITYSVHVARNRALLDVDGLNPARRVLLHAMYESGLTPKKPFVKAARVVGETLKYHPHGPSSLEGSLANMAQSFSTRVPLVDYSGSVGEHYGDQPASSRYYEVRLSPGGYELAREIKEGAVELVPNYDDKEVLPKVMPSRFPATIINGSRSIAVGFASKVPEHNPTEVMRATRALLRNPDLTVDEIMGIMPGPDFCRGGRIYGTDGIKSYYETGTGSFIVRAKYHIEEMAQGKVKIVFTEVPPEVSPEKVILEIQKWQSPQEKKTKGRKTLISADPDLSRGIQSVKDLTDKDRGLMLVVETTKGYNYRQVLDTLFKKTSLQIIYSVNFTTLVNRTPALIGVKDALLGFIDFRRVCVANKLITRKKSIEAKMVKLEAILLALLDIDKCIKIIRRSESPKEARESLIEAFGFTDEQVKYILEIQLRSLTKADRNSLENDKAEFLKELDYIDMALKSPEEIDNIIEKELVETEGVIGDARRAEIFDVTVKEFNESAKDIAKENKALSKKSDCYVTRFVDGSVMVTMDEYVHSGPISKNPPIVEQIKVSTTDNLIFVDSSGTGYREPISFVGVNRRVFLDSIVPGVENNRIVGVSKTECKKEDKGLAIFTAKGKVKVSKADYPVSAKEVPVISIDSDDQIVGCRWLSEKSKGFFVAVTDLGKIIVFDSNTVNPTGSKAKGVNGMNTKGGEVIYFTFVDESDYDESQLVTATNNSVKRAVLSEFSQTGRGGMGVATQNFGKGDGNLVAVTVSTNPISVYSGDNQGFQEVSLPPISRKNLVGEKLLFPIAPMLGSGAK